jgi:hypothetical protein
MRNGDTTAEAEIRQLAQEWMDTVVRRDSDYPLVGSSADF